MTVLDLDEANKRIEELEGKLGEESLKVIELQGRLERRRLIIEALAKELASAILTLCRIVGAKLPERITESAKAAGFDV